MNINEKAYYYIHYLEGTLSSEEQRKFENCLLDNEELLKDFREFQLSWIYSSNSIPSISKTIQVKVCKRLKIQKRRSLIYILSVAVVVIFLLFPFIYTYIPYFEDNQENTFLPGCSCATLFIEGDKPNVFVLDSSQLERQINGVAFISTGKELSIISKVDKPIIWNRVVVPKGGEFKVNLSDGTQVWLNSQSELRYPSRFTTLDRKVYLMGEAYFEVTKDAMHPFIVDLNGKQIVVKGTSFNIRSYPSYPLEATLVTGAISFRTNTVERNLNPGDQLQYTNESLTIKSVDVEEYTSWKFGYFIFRNRRFVDIIEELSRWYDFTYEFSDSSLSALSITAKLYRFDNAEELFKILEEIGGIKITKKGVHHLYIRKK